MKRLLRVRSIYRLINLTASFLGPEIVDFGGSICGLLLAVQMPYESSWTQGDQLKLMTSFFYAGHTW
jgi:hypothetical protein